MDKGKSQAKAVAPTQKSLFNAGKRTNKGIADRDESHFSFLNRSAWKSVGIARRTLENWFSVLPESKKEDIRSRFRIDERQHHGALLELAIHQLLNLICTGVQVDPSFNNLTPDFAATYEGTKLVVECTVTQETDQDFNATQREVRIKKAIDSIDTGRFLLSWDLLSAGEKQPPTGVLCGKIKRWVDSLDADEEMLRFERSHRTNSMEWRQDGWEIHFEALPVHSYPTQERVKRAIGIEYGGGGWRQDDVRLKKALTKKAAKYRHLELPFLVVLSSASVYVYEQDLIEALLGHTVLVGCFRPQGIEPDFQPRHEFDGLFGSPSKPKNRHLSAILFKPRIGVWTLCAYDAPWLLIHHPWAEYPLPLGMFPFATEWIPKAGEFAKVRPTVTLNAVLGLADPWPGMER
ncbi:MAG: hypothetical protein F4Y42_17275 [Caldilineaceae bacterium SB0664_bin_27]|uniref:Uncharacterized protein n=1 Tax=Caldilineaceae bacterium SB0664_bin_27 TaxID=2605260 RepID=A0A6B0YVV0_9CHLR|nr:hypothetical protein [Caldilineaceae bacterium SB0664_bin_27]